MHKYKYFHPFYCKAILHYFLFIVYLTCKEGKQIPITERNKRKMKKIEMLVTNGKKTEYFVTCTKEEKTFDELKKQYKIKWMNETKLNDCKMVYFQVTDIE